MTRLRLEGKVALVTGAASGVGQGIAYALATESTLASLDPATQELVRLFHPRQDRWAEHFRIVGPILEPLTPDWATTARLICLNVAARVVDR